MIDDVTVLVDCIDAGKVIRTYDSLYPASLAGPAVLDAKTIEAAKEAAKENLSTERLAAPPYTGIEFRVRIKR